jgi:hypothetical protein
LRGLASCTGPSCHKSPRLRLVVRSAGQPVERCVRDDLRVLVRGSEREHVSEADVLVGRRRVGRVVATPLVEDIPRGRLRSSGRFRLRVRAETDDGRRLTLDRTLRTCG